MAIEFIDSKTLKQMFIAGANYLEKNKKYVDELNVFPVPDGDTGTNMSLTILSAAREVESTDDGNMAAVAKAISTGSLRGARGNSGVILSQLLRGFSKEIKDVEKIDTAILANAMQKGVETAYKAVMKPKEGTILTVAREAAEKASSLALESDDMVYVMKETLKYANEVLDKTPDMLPVLKQAGVVDAGGQGLLYIAQGALAALTGDIEVSLETPLVSGDTPKMEHLSKVSDDIEFGYCTEFIIYTDLDSEKEGLKLRSFLETIGDSIVVVADEEIVKVHVHTNDPGLALQNGLKIGELSSIKIDNMREQHSSKVLAVEETTSTPVEPMKPAEPRKDVGFVVVSIGTGLNEIFNGLGADYIIEGGQTMNPSTDDLLQAINNVNAENVFILPNNKNIILAAQQARELCSDKNIIVIPSKTIPQGITAMINFEHEKGVSENAKNMEDSMAYVSTGQLTFAVRDTSIDEKTIQEGDILGIGNGKILTVKKELDSAAKELISQLVDEDSELVTIYYGEEVNENKAEVLAEYIEANFEDCDVEIHYGGQPLYYYILSVE